MSGRHEVWLVDDGSRLLAVKRFDLSTRAGANRLRREAATLRLLSDPGHLLAVDDQAGLICVETPTADTLWPIMHANPPRELLLVIAESAADAVARMHALDPLPGDVAPEHGPVDDLPVSPAQLMLSLVLHEHGLLPSSDLAFSDRRVLLHGDLRWVNMLWHDERVTLIDFEATTSGPREADLAAVVADFLEARVRSASFHEETVGEFIRTFLERYGRATRQELDAASLESHVIARLLGSAWESERGRERVAQQTLEVCDVILEIARGGSLSWAGWRAT